MARSCLQAYTKIYQCYGHLQKDKSHTTSPLSLPPTRKTSSKSIAIVYMGQELITLLLYTHARIVRLLGHVHTRARISPHSGGVHPNGVLGGLLWPLRGPNTQPTSIGIAGVRNLAWRGTNCTTVLVEALSIGSRVRLGHSHVHHRRIPVGLGLNHTSGRLLLGYCKLNKEWGGSQ